MSTKSIKFYKYVIDIEDDEDFTSLKNIKNDNKKPHIDNEGIKVKVDLFNGEFFSERFYGINIELGDSTHYSDEVVDTKDNLKIKDNPRKETEIELDKQLFLLIDINNKTIYLSNGTKTYREFAQDRLSKETGHSVSISEFLNRESFENSLSTISELNFCFKGEDLFNRSDDLSTRLNQDKLQYEADSIRVIFHYQHTSISGRLKNLVSKYIRNNANYQDLKIVGKDANGLETIFQPDAILSAIEITTELDKKTKKADYKKVFEKLIKEIQKNE